MPSIKKPSAVITGVSRRDAAMSDVQATKFLVVHSVEGENLNMTNPKEHSAKDFILVPSGLLYDATNVPHDQNDSASSSGDEISIHVEGPPENDDELLSSSALTAVSTQPDTDADDTTATEELDPDPEAYARPRPGRVRFRSRVRITSGLHHHRHHLSAASTSSLTSSRSSSISAPLRSPLTDENCSPGWGTLGKRVSLFAYSGRQAAAAAALARSAKQQERGRRRRGLADLADAGATTEQTALLGEAAPPMYDGQHSSPESEEGDGYFSSDDEYNEDALSRQIDLVFGKWPGRLLNRQWWWWQLQPIVGCGCLDESDGED
ncbi:hypothetical protein C8R44DRAFT_764643 [Mycena epipterygia]|nr:hypothetical protein C8R44DRAFT_764643 [Mycena epipterygia]